MFQFGIGRFFRITSQFVNRSQMQMESLKLNGVSVITEQNRFTSFFNKLSSESLIKAITSVSNAGKKRGRGKTIRRRIISDLNKGQQVGVGAGNIKWPGLNVNVMEGQDIVQIEKLPPDPEYHSKLIANRSQGAKRKLYQVHPLERGWSGKSPCGRKYGPPPITGYENLSNFESTVLEIKHLNTKRNVMGGIRAISIYAITGNHNGLLGLGVAQAADQKTAIQKAIKKAATRLIHFKLEDKTTLNHDFYYKMGKVKVFAYKKPPGYGLVCHRGIAECCKLIGIKDIYAKVEGSRNKQHTIKAFLLGLLEQKTYQQMADEKQLHLVEMKKEKMYFPTVLASPAVVSKTNNSEETFSEYVMGGKLTLKKTKTPMELLPQYEKYLKKTHYRRNHEEVINKLWVEYGECRSYLADIYPECRCTLPKKISAEKPAAEQAVEQAVEQ